jgi:hypothetical protein
MVSAVAVANDTPHATTRPSASVPRIVSTVGSTWLTSKSSLISSSLGV